MDQDSPTARPPAGWLLREVDVQLAQAADALAQGEPAYDVVCRCLDRAREAVSRLRADLTAGEGGADPDPAALALVRRTELAPERTSSRRARAFAAQTCELWALPTSVRNAAVDIASELVANAVAHGSGPVVLVLERGAGNLLVRAWDDGPGVPRVLPYRPGLSERGLGLRLVKQLSSHWGATEDDGGKWVWARIALPSPPAG